jgi:hypothetical protein
MTDGEEALRAYGYVFDQSTGFFVRTGGKRTQKWVKAERGWHRFEADDSQCPVRVAPESPVQDGLDFKNEEHVKYFDWVWTDEEVSRIYDVPTNKAVYDVPTNKAVSITALENRVKKRHRIRFWMKD